MDSEVRETQNPQMEANAETGPEPTKASWKRVLKSASGRVRKLFAHRTSKPEGTAREAIERPDRKSVAFFRDIQDSMIEEIGIPNSARVSELISQATSPLTIAQDQVSALKEQGAGQDMLQKHEQDLAEKSLAYKTTIARFKDDLRRVEKTEIDPQVREFLAKYQQDTLYDLLEHGLDLEPDELGLVSSTIQETLAFRNRKISEFIGFRFARTNPVDGNAEQFIRDAQSIFRKWNRPVSYRSKELDNYDATFTSLPVQFVPDAISHLVKRIEQTAKSTDIAVAQSEALKMYLLFEGIHPFDDGNGRTGRSLFVYLQRKFFTGSNALDFTPIHMPVARYETGTTLPKVVQDSKQQAPGSLAFDCNVLVKRIIQDQRIADLYQRLDRTDSSVAENFVDSFSQLLDSPAISQQVDELLNVITQQSQDDKVTNEDWNMVYQSLTKKLKGK